jgi:pilus assembly protein CpaC
MAGPNTTIYKGNRMRRSLSLNLTAPIALAMVCLALSGIAPANAQEGQHRSYVRISETSGAARPINIGLNKSMIIDLPREVREVMISNPEKIEAVLQTSTRAYVIGKKAGEANVLFIDKDGRQVVSLEISVERDLSHLDQMLARLIPGSKIHIESIGERTVLSGTVQNPIDAARACEIVTAFLGPLDQLNTSDSGGSSSSAIQTPGQGNGSGGGCAGGGDSNAGNSAPKAVLNMITVEAREQVLLKVSVVEMERNILKQFGVDLGTLVNSGNFAFAALSKLPFPMNTQGGGVIAPFVPNPAGALPGDLGTPSFVSQGVAGGGVQWLTGENRVQTVLRALESDGLLHTLAEPNLTAISGETANFLAGGEFPIPIAQQLGTISVEFKKFGIGLAFTPVVMSEGRISLKVSTEVSELSNQGAVVLSNITIPALKVRRAETMVELPSGGSLVMAGLLSDQSKQALSGYPGLKNLPVLGTLFRSRDFLRNETELVVLVTPYVVKPVARSELAQPDDGFGWASDLGSDFMGQMNRVYGRHPERAPVGRFDGDVGFIVE